jgi:hypothetical protein
MLKFPFVSVGQAKPCCAGRKEGDQIRRKVRGTIMINELWFLF